MRLDKIYYGVVGAGHIGNYHAQQIQNIKHVVLQGIYDISETRAQKVATKYQTLAFQSLQETIKQCNVITIATPAHSHFKIAIQALKRGCHVFIEKPITTNLQDADDIIALAKEKNLLVQVGHIERFNPAFIRLLQNKHLSKTPFIESERLAPFNLRGLDVNVILDLMVHDIDLILHIKQCSIKTVQAIGIKVLSKTVDLANARIVFEDSSVANLTASRISDTTVRKLRIFNKQQYFSVDLQNHNISCYAVQSKQPKQNNKKLIFSSNNKFIVHTHENLPKKNALYQELVSFIASIQEAKTTTVDANAGRDAIKLALLIQKKINESNQK